MTSDAHDAELLAPTSGPPAGPVARRPRLRGVSHQYAFFGAMAATVALIVLAPSPLAEAGAVVYGLTLCGLFAISALYHRVDWPPRGRRWMRRLDHSMIFIFIAGSYTPLALLAVTHPLSIVILGVVWAGALAGVALTLAWSDAPRWLDAVVYLALGWAGIASCPQIVDHAGAGALALILVGGLLYTVGAVIYARRRPDPRPAVFGYHEIFHALVIAAAVVQYLAIVLFVLPPHGGA